MKIYKYAFIALLALIFAGCQATSDQPLSPTETMKASNDAAIKKNVDAIKKLVSRGTLERLEQSAKAENTTVDELLKDFLDAPSVELPEIRNEKITGDAATIEIKNNATNEWETMPFVRENGVWKIAYDVFLDDLLKRRNEETKEIPVNQPPAAADQSAPKTAPNSAVKK